MKFKLLYCEMVIVCGKIHCDLMSVTYQFSETPVRFTKLALHCYFDDSLILFKHSIVPETNIFCFCVMNKLNLLVKRSKDQPWVQYNKSTRSKWTLQKFSIQTCPWSAGDSALVHKCPPATTAGTRDVKGAMGWDTCLHSPAAFSLPSSETFLLMTTWKVIMLCRL